MPSRTNILKKKEMVKLDKSEQKDSKLVNIHWHENDQWQFHREFLNNLSDIDQILILIKNLE